MDSKEKLSFITISLHWLVGVLMIYMLVSGLVMDDVEIRWLFDSHTSFGVAIVALVIPRVIWRYANGWPESVGDYSKFEKISGKAVHWLLILATVLMPLSGILMALGGGHGLSFFDYEIIASVENPLNSEEPLVVYPMLESIGGAVHDAVGSTLLPAALLLHIAGALKHHIVDKDKTMTRMLGK
ncbi:cytochrome b [Vibrio sp. SCSIO 43137]|uniref:cytochrome b n=1 Tax=Vibrio sp. SCSIO 43137 TaxID=3021011 RepID=UPI0023070C9B|nr:cytochrome b [Vibrio sp. SCSIO 43137]WCE31600.1 cytochrome b [Vibrio sp. SCSIO 43137]